LTAEPIEVDRAPACGHRFRIDVGDAQAVAQAVSEDRKADEARPGAPLEGARDLRHAAPAQERDEILAERRAAAVEVRLVGDPDAPKGRAAPRLEAPQQRLDVAVLELLPQRTVSGRGHVRFLAHPCHGGCSCTSLPPTMVIDAVMSARAPSAIVSG